MPIDRTHAATREQPRLITQSPFGVICAPILVVIALAAGPVWTLVASGRIAWAAILSLTLTCGVACLLRLVMDQRRYSITTEGVTGFGVVRGTLPWSAIDPLPRIPSGGASNSRNCSRPGGVRHHVPVLPSRLRSRSAAPPRVPAHLHPLRRVLPAQQPCRRAAIPHP